MIHLKNIEVGYANPLFHAEDIQLETGKVYALIGSNGSGKTTLLHAIIGRKHILSGTVFVNQKDVRLQSQKELAKNVAFVSSKFEGVEHLTVREYITLGRAPHTDAFGRLRPNDHQQIDYAIRALCIEEFCDRLTQEISDGERQLAAIARAISQDTTSIILDEPTAFLDYGNRKRLIRTLHYIAKELDKCVVFSTHDIDLCLEEEIALLLIDQSNGTLSVPFPISKTEILAKGFNYRQE
jgi:iron complex transport system ATP-binding protein